MSEISLRPMTRSLCHELFRGWENDPAVFADEESFRPYTYSAAAVDRYFDEKRTPARVMLAVILDGHPVGEVQLKKIDRESGECTLSIHLQSDAYKNRGLGTQAERLAVRYAFDTLGLGAVNAETLVGNGKSRRVLEKVGFLFLREESGFRYYRIEKGDILP